MKTSALLMILLLIAALSCTKKSEDPNTTTPAQTDKGYGTFTFGGKTLAFTAFAQIPANNLLTASSTALEDTLLYTLSVSLSPRPLRDTSFSTSIGPSRNGGEIVFLTITSSTGSRAAETHYYYNNQDRVYFENATGKLYFKADTMTETTQNAGVLSSGESLTFNLHQKI